jgi:hypothetical protein
MSAKQIALTVVIALAVVIATNKVRALRNLVS